MKMKSLWMGGVLMAVALLRGDVAAIAQPTEPDICTAMAEVGGAVAAARSAGMTLAQTQQWVLARDLSPEVILVFLLMAQGVYADHPRPVDEVKALALLGCRSVEP